METSISYHFHVSQNSLPLFFFQPFKNEKENMFSSPAISKRAVGQHGPQAIVCKPLVYTQLLFLTLSHAVSIPRAVCSLDKPLHLQILYHPRVLSAWIIFLLPSKHPPGSSSLHLIASSWGTTLPIKK